MAKIDKTVKKETAIIAGGSAVCSVLMNLIFFLVARFTDICEYKYTVITGSVLGWAIAVLNFLLMGVTIQNAVALEDKQMAKKKIQLSYMLRTGLLVAAMAAGVLLPWFHWLPVLISVIFPRIVIFFRSIVLKKTEGKTTSAEKKEGER